MVVQSVLYVPPRLHSTGAQLEGRASLSNRVHYVKSYNDIVVHRIN